MYLKHISECLFSLKQVKHLCINILYVSLLQKVKHLQKPPLYQQPDVDAGVKAFIPVPRDTAKGGLFMKILCWIEDPSARAFILSTLEEM